MKTNYTSIFTPVDKKGIDELLKETKETIASDLLLKKEKSSTFTVVDLWRLQKKHKSLGSSTRW
ncbi:MAG TPA: hypothetical protein PLC48_07960 [Ferruginibacter sp.]|nr:hypothetical protein [Ferruginibacter sp.]